MRRVLQQFVPLFRKQHYAPRPLMACTPPEAAACPSRPPRIAIVTPSYNQVEFLEQTLRSVLDQNYPNLEYVVQDGGSTDGSVEILQRYGSRLLHWESAPDGGQSDAINRGFAQTRGEIMAWLNSDDLLLPGALNRVAAFFASHPAVDVVYGNRVLLDQAGNDVGCWVLPPHDAGVLPHLPYIPQETMFWRRSLWERVGGMDASFQFAMDWDLELRFAEAGGRFQHLPCFLGGFRIHPTQKTSSQAVEVGQPEMRRLRQRTFGKVPPFWRITLRSSPYLVRHMLHHAAYRCHLTGS